MLIGLSAYCAPSLAKTPISNRQYSNPEACAVLARLKRHFCWQTVGMSVEVETRDCASLTDIELEELAAMGGTIVANPYAGIVLGFEPEKDIIVDTNSEVSQPKFEPNFKEKYKSSEFQYEAKITEKSLWDKFKEWLAYWFKKIFGLSNMNVSQKYVEYTLKTLAVLIV